MKKQNYKIYEINESRIKRLLNNAVVVFDTSALLDFYYYPELTRKSIFEEILTKYKDRLWIPGHVEYEFLKNREKTIDKTIADKYESLVKNDLNTVRAQLSKIDRNIEQLKSKTKKPDSHPYLDQTEIEIFSDEVKLLNKSSEIFTKQFQKTISKSISKIEKLKSKDTVLSSFQSNFETGPQLQFSEQLKIIEEGRIRYKNEIPPGYMDDSEKFGTQKYGDLFIWKQILDLSKAKNCDVVFICNDMKIDWCHVESRNRIAKPRDELIKEFNDNNGKTFWMFNQSQFLFLTKQHIGAKIDDKKIEEVSNVILQNRPLTISDRSIEDQVKNLIRRNFERPIFIPSNFHSDFIFRTKKEINAVQILSADIIFQRGIDGLSKFNLDMASLRERLMFDNIYVFLVSKNEKSFFDIKLELIHRLNRITKIDSVHFALTYISNSGELLEDE